jgi:hypothetical protein
MLPVLSIHASHTGKMQHSALGVLSIVPAGKLLVASPTEKGNYFVHHSALADDIIYYIYIS